jgi:acetyl-CoA carboxylase biotin carboxyl carrier protein
MTYAPAPAAAAPTAAPAPVPASPAMPPAVSAAEAEEANFLPIKSPMVGTFYAAPSKGAKPFVTVGTKVDEESDVCIVEAMKVFNNIKAECSGTIARILVNDSQPVEFGQVLFLVKPN